MSNSICHPRFTFAILVGAFCLVACGADHECPPGCDESIHSTMLAQCDELGCPGGTGEAVGIASGFAGTWVGSADFSTEIVDGNYSFNPFPIVTVSGSTMTVQKFGRDADGYISATGIGTKVSWTGSAVVNAGDGACPSASVEYTSGTFTLLNNIVLYIHLIGTHTACGAVYQAEYYMSSNQKVTQ